MNAWVLLLAIVNTDASHGADPQVRTTLQVTPIYFQKENACKLVAAKLETNRDRILTGIPGVTAKCFSTKTGAGARIDRR